MHNIYILVHIAYHIYKRRECASLYVCMYVYIYVGPMCEQPRGKGTPGYRDLVF